MTILTVLALGDFDREGIMVMGNWCTQTHSLSIKIAQKPYIIGSLGPKAVKCESFDARGLPAQK